jgi:hypothetical protein
VYGPHSNLAYETRSLVEPEFSLAALDLQMRIWPLFLVIGSASLPAIAADLARDMAKCSADKNNVTRLECYNALARKASVGDVLASTNLISDKPQSAPCGGRRLAGQGRVESAATIRRWLRFVANQDHE